MTNLPLGSIFPKDCNPDISIHRRRNKLKFQSLTNIVAFLREMFRTLFLALLENNGLNHVKKKTKTQIIISNRYHTKSTSTFLLQSPTCLENISIFIISPDLDLGPVTTIYNGCVVKAQHIPSE